MLINNSERLYQCRRDLYKLKATLESYHHEAGKMSDINNIEKIYEYVMKLFPLIDQEIDTAKRYERWLKND